jgi:hypothetical protein
MIKSKIQMVEHEVGMGEMGGTCRVLVGKPEQAKEWMEDGIQTDVKQMRYVMKVGLD